MDQRSFAKPFFTLGLTASDWQGGLGETPDNPAPLPAGVLVAGVGSLLFLLLVLAGAVALKGLQGAAGDGAATESSKTEDPVERTLEGMIARLSAGEASSPPSAPPTSAPSNVDLAAKPTEKPRGFGKQA